MKQKPKPFAQTISEGVKGCGCHGGAVARKR